MAVMTLQKNMAFWEVSVDNVKNWEAIVGNIVSNMTIVYEINKPTTAEIMFSSESFVEDVFSIGRTVSIKIGFDPLDLIPMFSGVIMSNPLGIATDNLQYVVKLESNEIYMSTHTKNKVFNPPKKKDIIEQIAGFYGFDTDISIKDVNNMKKTSTPIQKNQTDLEYLYICAQRWDCVFWFTTGTAGQTTLHFYDSITAYGQGNNQKMQTVEDKFPDYMLGYRSNSTLNNVAKVSWKSLPTQGDGEPGIKTLLEGGIKEIPENFTIFHKEQRWQLNKKTRDFMSLSWSNRKYFFVMMGIAYKNGVGHVDATVKQFFEVCDTGSRTSQDKRNSEAVETVIDLNIGDPWLRPPRTAKLLYGSDDPRAVSTSLPYYIYGAESPENTLFRMRKVKTSLNAGKLSTQITLRRSVDE